MRITGYIGMLLVMLCYMAPGQCYAQKERQLLVDSLLAELSKQEEDTNKVKVLNELSYQYHPINPDEGIKYGKQSLELSSRLDWKVGVARANLVLGNNHLRKSDNPGALRYYREAMKIYTELGDKAGIARATSNTGLIYLSENDYPRALDYFLKALNTYEETGNKAGIAIACDNIGDVMKNQHKYADAMKYYLRSLALNRELGKIPGIAGVTTSIGEVYVHERNYALAIACMLRALELDAQIGDKLGVAWALTSAGSAYLAMLKDTAASETNVDTSDIARQLLPASVRLPSRAKLWDTAVHYLQGGLEKSREIHALDAMQYCYKHLADAYLMKRNYRKARDYYIEYASVRDSVFSKENSEKIVKIEYEHTRYYDSLKTAEEKMIADLRLKHQRNYSYIGLVVIMLLSGFTFFVVKERKKSDKLLLNILPQSVAAELKSKGQAKAKHFDNVTVLFTDFVNFTKASENMSPQQLIDELHICFKAFDEITARYGIEKIKTIGDAYLAVAGLPVADPQHAEHAVQAAIDISRFIRDRRAHLQDHSFEIRIGVHSGSVVAGIVGVKKFAYDIWGDTVTMAARLEESGTPGKVSISQATYTLVKGKFTDDMLEVK